MKKIFSIRTISQIGVVMLILFLSYSHQKYGIEKAAPIDSYCPFGAIEGFLTYLFTGAFLQRLYSSTFLLGILVIVFTIIFGRVFCSFFCPLGALSEWMRIMGKKIGIKNDYELPKYVDKYARYIKYLILILIMYFSYKTGDLIFRENDPFNALTHLGAEFSEKKVGYSLLFLILGAGIFSKSWWCRYFCPFGAFLGLIKKISPFKIQRKEESCISCGICSKACPAGIDIEKNINIKDADCISCLECVDKCSKDSLSSKIFNKEISKKYFNIIVVGGFIVSLIILTSSPLWQTKQERSNVINDQGVIDVDNIKGSNTIGHIIEQSGISYSVFQKELGLPEKIEADIKLKEIGQKYNIKDENGDFIHTEAFREVIRKTLEEQKEKCPFNVEDDNFPGKCGLYTDDDNNDICDLSE